MSIGGTPASEMEQSGIELAEAIRKRGACRTNNPKEKAGKGVLYGKNIIYFRISYRGTSG